MSQNKTKLCQGWSWHLLCHPNVNLQTILLQMVCSLTLDGFSTRMKARERKGEKLWRAIRARIIPNDTSYINRKLAFLPAIQKINQTMILQIQITCLNVLDQRHICGIHPCKRLFCVHLLLLSTTYLPGCKHSHL